MGKHIAYVFVGNKRGKQATYLKIFGNISV